MHYGSFFTLEQYNKWVQLTHLVNKRNLIQFINHTSYVSEQHVREPTLVKHIELMLPLGKQMT